ncbi:hypothetical protein CSA37_02085 [Candidatus Fermentibacteria bacterium]|nr:MAG: hypothetical protein CSA37_02085 [Candidatus Fermentibacteria bacterium]
MKTLMIITVAVTGNLFAEWLNFNAGAIIENEPIEEFNKVWNDCLTFDVELRGLSVDTLTEDAVKYLRFTNTPGIILSDRTGLPELPIVRCFVWVPDSTDLSFSYSANCAEVISCLPVYPVPIDSLVVDQSSGYFIGEFFTEDSIAYISSDWYPNHLVEYVDELRFRDARIAIYDVYPVQYLAVNDSLRVWSDIQVTVSFDETTSKWPVIDTGYFCSRANNSILGYTKDDNPWIPVPGLVMRPTDLTAGPVRVPDYVILTAAGLDGSWIDSLARHRADLCGFDVAIIRTDSVLSQFSNSQPITPLAIRDFTETMWNWGQPSSSKRPSYLLLIGDSEDPIYGSSDWYLPSHSYEEGLWKGDNSIYDDEWYVYFDEPYSTYHSIPDMMVGRISVRTTQELQGFINVIRGYEAASTIPAPDTLMWRRHLSFFKGEFGPQWKPDSSYVDSLRQWCGYTWDYVFGGDFRPYTTSDGSTMSSLEWDSLLDSSLSRGQQLVVYTNHGIPHVFSAGMDWNEPVPPEFQGLPDSTFDCFDVDSLSESSFIPHGYPFIINACCSTGRFAHTIAEHTDFDDRFYFCFNDNPNAGPVFDYGIDSISEKFLKHPDAGAIGFFAGSGATGISGYDRLAHGLMEAILYYGQTRMGDAIASMRFRELPSRISANIALYDLLGDPAVDLGDRVKFRNSCDLIVAPPDLELLRYPAKPSGTGTAANLSVTVRNAGAVASGDFDAELDIEICELNYDTTLTESFSCIAAGNESTVTFDGWRVPSGITSDMELIMTCEADPDRNCNDSWTPNNSAVREISILDFYPCDSGWPIRVAGSIKSPPVLADLNNDGDLEIVFVQGNAHVCAVDPSYPDTLMWESQAYMINPRIGSGFSIPTVADVTGDGNPEVIFDTIDKLVVLDGSDGDYMDSFAHDTHTRIWQNFPQTVVVSDLFIDDDVPLPKNEIAFVASDMLYILRYQSDGLARIDSVTVVSADEELTTAWLTAGELDGNTGSDLILSTTYYSSVVNSLIGLYSSHKPGTFYETRTWKGLNFSTIPAVGDFGSGNLIAVSKRISSTHNPNPVDLIEPLDLSTAACCSTSSATRSIRVFCCVIADWVASSAFDRIIAPAENQCFVFEADGEEDWNYEYADPSPRRPPFPALGDLDGDGKTDLLVGTRDGFVNAFTPDGREVSGFPYTLPSEVFGGFVIADIDNDRHVEVVFGTMDNYLHVWELGSCDAGYSPWLQVQHDSERSGAQE